VATNISQAVLLITTRCNLNCKLCYINEECPSDANISIIESTLQYLNLQLLKEIIISGGEPLLRPDLIFFILNYIERYSNIKVSLQTNGTLLTEEFLKRLKRYKLGIGISLDGPIEINDKLRGQTSKVLNALEILSRLDIKIGITITISKYNYLALSNLLILLSQFPCIKLIGLDPLRPIGRASTKDIAPLKDFEKSLQEFKKVFNWINKKRKSPIILSGVFNNTAHKDYCYGASGKLLVMHPRGSFWACPSLLNNLSFYIGDIKTGIKKSIKLKKLDPYCKNKLVKCIGRCPVRSWLSLEAGKIDCIIRKTFLGVYCNI